MNVATSYAKINAPFPSQGAEAVEIAYEPLRFQRIPGGDLHDDGRWLPTS
jgi:hypothetical protein